MSPLIKLHTRTAAGCVKFQTPRRMEHLVKSTSILQSLDRELPAPRRPRAAVRVREDLSRHLLLVAQLQRSWQCPCGCWLRPCGHLSHWFEGEMLVWYRHLHSQRVAAELFAKAWKSFASRYPFEYHARSLVHIEYVLGPTSGSKGSGRLSLGESR